MNKTTENLRKALSGEARACLRYLGYARKAEEEGYPAVARLFRAAAMAEKTHAQSLQGVLKTEEPAFERLRSQSAIDQEIERLKVAGAIKDTLENLNRIIEEEEQQRKGGKF